MDGYKSWRRRGVGRGGANFPAPIKRSGARPGAWRVSGVSGRHKKGGRPLAEALPPRGPGADPARRLRDLRGLWRALGVRWPTDGACLERGRLLRDQLVNNIAESAWSEFASLLRKLLAEQERLLAAGAA